ncbi:MAG: TolC family protein [Deltaproteobacteria bacterium]|nr:TolC family protein [Deltaproteobacteria bacterium]
MRFRSWMIWIPLFCGALGVRAQTGTATSATLRVPQVTDAMLAPPKAAELGIDSWTQALDLIRARSPSYQASAQAVVAAQGQQRIALAGVLPTLTAQAGILHQFNTEMFTLAGTTFESPPPDVWNLGATLSWNIVQPRALYGLGTAQRNVDAARLSLADTRRQLASNVVAQLLSTLAAARVAELNRVGLRSALERLALTEARLQYAQGTELDRDRAKQDVALARAQLIAGDESLAQTRESLGALLGSDRPMSANVQLDLTQLEDAVAKTCKLNHELEQRPDLQAAKLRLEVAERSVRDAQLQASPYVNVTSSLAHASATSLSPLTTWSVGATLWFPLYDGGVRYGVLQQAQAQVSLARAALEDTRLNAVISSARADRAVSVLTASRDLAREQRDTAQRIDARIRDGWAQGIGTSLDLVTSAQSLRNAENALALLEFQVAQARANAVLINAECVY